MRFTKITMQLCPSLEGLQLCAITDFAYNLGAGSLRHSTLRKCINNGDMESAVRELAKWVNGGGKRLPGLVSRRSAEAALLRGA
jgi:lysozyme